MTLTEAARLLTRPDVLAALAYHGRDCRARDELAARLERESVRAERCRDGLARRGDYGDATIEREQARTLRLWAEALRVVEAAS